ncbi:hypothetical protein MLD38_017127 [Melastoma candidum]|uniref:Uncharacterized protein n=1 Tax=Melastoma candidum TaxID=119954 RepID=A0ACB9QTN0_9MYRT|nr:hypothetical protein MLD38_017127 [Melastoma candidum]
MEFGQPRTSSCEGLIPGLPDDVAVECFLRLPYTAHSSACRVSRSWSSLLQSQRFYSLRRTLHRSSPLACLVQQSPPSSPDDPIGKPAAPAMNHSIPDGLAQSYSVLVFDPGSLSWARVPPIPDFPDGLPLFCQLASTDGKLLVLGGWDPATYSPLRRVYLHDFITGKWRRCAEMPGTRTFFAAAGADGGRVFVAGGHDECKNALSTAWAYDVGRDEWEEMEGMSQERDECEGAILGGGREFWVVSGYRTERQGEFEGSADVYEIGEGGRAKRRRRRVEGAWEEGKCPRGGVGLGGVTEAGVRVVGVVVGGRAVLVGSEYPGGKQGFYVGDGKGDGNFGKFVRVEEVPDEFSGFVQSGCFIEV